VRRVPFTHVDKLTVCRAHALALCPWDKLQLKANGAALDGSKLANGEIVTVACVRANGAIRLDDGRTLPPAYRQFQRGYAVTSYGSQGKTVDHVLFGDAAVRAASNAQQWYVTISRGRKSIQIFTPDKEQLAAPSSVAATASWRSTSCGHLDKAAESARSFCAA
jgi:ATP-dependent exoDNAse (exonuclease V) alpha subunit